MFGKNKKKMYIGITILFLCVLGTLVSILDPYVEEAINFLNHDERQY